MNIPIKKLKSGFEIPVFGIGTWKMGGRFKRDPKNDDTADIKAIQAAIDKGVAHVDTAEIYAAGFSEILVGKAIEKYDRSKLFIVSKVKGENFAYRDLINACEKSLERLRTNYLDLYLLHWYEESPPLKETIEAMDELVARGLTKNIGVCNFGKEHLAEAQKYAKNKIVCDQVHYNLIFREPERKGLLEYCQKNDIMLIAWRPTELGKLTKKVPNILKQMCEKYQKTPVQMAINWLISQNNVVTIAKSRNISHLMENLGAIGWNMDKDDIEMLREKIPGQKNISDTVPLE